MVPNLSRKIFAILAALIVTVWSLSTFGIQKGLDLQGGSRLVYRFDFDKAAAEGQIDLSRENPKVILNETVAIFQRRIDAYGLREIPITTQGDAEIVIELPGGQPDEVEKIKEAIVNQGRLEFRIVVDPTDDLNLQGEIDKFKAWRTAHPDEPTVAFNRVPEKEGGPRAGVAWFKIADKALKDGSVSRVDPELDSIPLRKEDVLRPPASPSDSWKFTGGGLNRVGPTQDEAGYLAVRFEFAEYRKAAFADFTETYQGRLMAIVLNDEVQTAPVIRQKLPGGGIITGGQNGFSQDDMRELITVLRTGSLKVKPELESESFVGPSLGADSVRIGQNSALLGGFLVLIFMLLYYRMNGVVASLALIFNGVVLVGALAFTQATLTLPGLAGLVLTIGMAVDSNILIFERVREERKKGREVTQAYKNGFERAFTTIVDANLTTLLTALILFQVGTGPVRGFAATLSLGILTSMFAALVFSKVILHGMVFKKKPWITEVKMAHVFEEPKFHFIRWRKVAAICSTGLILIGLFTVASQGRELLGIDFTGGGVARIHLKEAVPISTVRTALGTGYTVTELEGQGAGTQAGGQGDAGAVQASSDFLVKVKLSPEIRQAFLKSGGETKTGEENFLADIRTKMDGMLAEKNPFPESSVVGPRVVEQIRDKAILAIFFSLIAIVIYMNFRFKEYRYGIAAVVALFHDVLFALGAVAVFHKFGAITIEIDLEIIAAFLTIIGYSLNDTIVIFDRIRENLPRRKGSFLDLIDHSINQTLSRTLLTSLTTFFVVAILFVANRAQHNVLEGFSFTMLIGIVVGTYSTVFIASPMLIFLDRWARKPLLTQAAASGAKRTGGGDPKLAKAGS